MLNLTIRQEVFPYIKQGYRSAKLFHPDESRLRDFMRKRRLGNDPIALFPAIFNLLERMNH